MNLKECYQQINGDYEGVVSRFLKEDRVQRFVLKFLNDKSYDLLISSMAEKNYQEAFRASHTIKGVCQNLGFSVLYKSSHDLTELLRNGYQDGVEELVEQVKQDYQDTIDAIKQLDV